MENAAGAGSTPDPEAASRSGRARRVASQPGSARRGNSSQSQGSEVGLGRREWIELDLRSLEYVEPYNENLTCAICYCPFFDPVKLKCDHYFCTQCIQQALAVRSSTSQKCPSCRSDVHEDDLVVVSKLVEKILDELQVKCPLHELGCESIVPRAGVHEHLRKFCGSIEVNCPRTGCPLKIPRKHEDKPCQHVVFECTYCQDSMMLLDLEHHRSTECTKRHVACPKCHAMMVATHVAAHAEACQEAAVRCSAAAYGCDASLTRKELDEHTATCPLAKLAPFLEMQARQLQEHQAAMDTLVRKNHAYKAAIRNMQAFLGIHPGPDAAATSTATPAPFSSTTDHLLSLHESLRDEVGRVAGAVRELEAKADTMFLNQSLRTTEELARTAAVLSSLRMQTQWLVSSKLQSQQRAAPLGEATVAGPSRATEPAPPRLSDSTRQETKL